MGLSENRKYYYAGFGKYRLGAWYYTSKFEDLTEVNKNSNPRMRNDNFGVCILAEKFLFAEKDDSTLGPAAFLRFGVANPNINVIDYYWGSGITFTDLNETAGIPINKNETISELTYSLQVNSWLRIQPAYQNAIKPMVNYPHQTDNVLGTRIQIIF